MAKSSETQHRAQTNRTPKRRLNAEPVRDLANRRCNHIFCLRDRQNPTLGTALAAMILPNREQAKFSADATKHGPWSEILGIVVIISFQRLG